MKIHLRILNIWMIRYVNVTVLFYWYSLNLSYSIMDIQGSLLMKQFWCFNMLEMMITKFMMKLFLSMLIDTDAHNSCNTCNVLICVLILLTILTIFVYWAICFGWCIIFNNYDMATGINYILNTLHFYNRSYSGPGIRLTLIILFCII